MAGGKDTPRDARLRKAMHAAENIMQATDCSPAERRADLERVIAYWTNWLEADVPPAQGPESVYGEDDVEEWACTESGRQFLLHNRLSSGTPLPPRNYGLIRKRDLDGSVYWHLDDVPAGKVSLSYSPEDKTS